MNSKIRKIIIALLVLAMIASVFAICLPMNLKAEAATLGATITETWTGTHKTEAQIEAETGKDFTAVTSYSELAAITSGTADALKYYCLVLPAGTETLVMSGKSHIRLVSNVYFDFNGYTVDVSGDNNGVFGALSNCTIKNLKMVGTLRYVSDRPYYSAKKGALGQSPLTTNGYNSLGSNGVVHLDNIVSEVNWTIHQQHGSGKYTGAIISSVAAGSTIKNCVFNGTIIAENDEDFLADTTTTGTKLESQPGNVGGIVGRSFGCEFTNCISKGSITIEEGVRFGASNNGAYLGGIAGYAEGNSTFQNCQNDMTIAVNAHAWKSDSDSTSVAGYLGGITGYSGSSSTINTYVNCTNNGTVTATTGTFYVGGITAYAAKGVKIKSSVNEKALKGTDVGGLIGQTADGVSIGEEGFLNVNNGVITATSSHGAGAIAYVSGATTISHFVNNANINAKNAGGVVATTIGSVTASDCVNNGTVKGSSNAAGIVAYLLSTDQTVAIDISSCLNTGNASAPYRAGGIFGYSNEGSLVLTITNCINGVEGLSDSKGKVTVSTCDDYGGAGGMVSCLNAATSLTVKGCTNFANIAITGSGDNQVNGAAGLVGTSKIATTIGGAEDADKCYNYGNITTNGKQAAGIIGYCNQNLTVTNAINRGDVTVNYGHAIDVDATEAAKDQSIETVAGGIVGTTATSRTIVLTGCENHGSVTANGTLSGTIKSNTTADVEAGTATAHAAKFTMNVYAGGIIPHANHTALTIENCNTYDKTSVIKSTFTDTTTKTGNYNTISNNRMAGGITARISVAPTFTGSMTTENSVNAVYAGGVAGYTNLELTYSNFTNAGDMSGSSYSGGIIGYIDANATFTNCSNSGNIVTSGRAGGMSAQVTGTLTATDCTNTGNITATQAQGGIVGKVGQAATCINCVNGDADAINQKGNLVSTRSSGSGEDLGGIVGTVASGEGIFEGCVNYGSLENASSLNSASKHMGGIVGRVYGLVTMGYDVDSLATTPVAGSPCYNYGNITVNSIYNNDHASTIAGLAGTGYVGMRAIGSENHGDVTIKDTNKWDGNGFSNTGVAGVVGALGGTTMYFEDCSNTGDIAYIGETNTHLSIAGIIGKMDGGGSNAVTIIGCSNTGDISNGRWTAGIAANANSGVYTITDTYNSGNITSGKLAANGSNTTDKAALGDAYIGGILAYVSSALNVDGCSNSGDVTYTWNAADGAGLYSGGIAGYTAAAATISNSNNEADAHVIGKHAGGMIGLSNSTAGLTNCHCYGDVTGSLFIGGLCGLSNGKATVSNCTTGEDTVITATGEIATGGFVGGFIGRGYKGPSITNSATYGEIIAIDWNNTGNTDTTYIAGIIGHSSNSGGYYVGVTNNANISVTNCSILSGVGGIVARNNGSMTLTDCTNNGEITVHSDAIFDRKANGWAQGVAGIHANGGAATTSYTRCINNGTINVFADTSVGGIAGYISDGSFAPVSCINRGAINVNADVATARGVGGIVGLCGQGLDMKLCVNDAPITVEGTFHTGGLVGWASKDVDASASYARSIVDCENTENGIITFTEDVALSTMNGVGGIIGYSGDNVQHATNTLVMTYCVNNADIVMPEAATGFKTYIGGVVGRVANPCHFTITYCTNNGNIWAETDATSSVSYAGGILGVQQSYGQDPASPATQVIENCVNTGALSAYRVGGIVAQCEVGGNANGKILRFGNLTLRGCTNTGTLTAVSYAAGMVCISSYSNSTGTDGSDTSTKTVYNIENCVNLGEIHGQHISGIVGMVQNVEMTLTGCISAGTLDGWGDVNLIAPIIIGEYNKYDDTITDCYYLEGVEIGANDSTAYPDGLTEKTAAEIEALVRGSGATLVVFDKADMEILYGIAFNKADKTGLEDAMEAVRQIIERGTADAGERNFFTTTQYNADIAYQTLYALLYPANFEEIFDIILPVSMTLEEGIQINVSEISLAYGSTLTVKINQNGIDDGANFKLYRVGADSDVIEFCFVDAQGNEIANNGTLTTFDWGTTAGDYVFQTKTKVDSDMPGKYKGTLTFTVDYNSAS